MSFCKLLDIFAKALFYFINPINDSDNCYLRSDMVKYI